MRKIASLDDPGEGDPLAVGSEEGTAQGAADGEEASADNPAVDNPGEGGFDRRNRRGRVHSQCTAQP